MNGSTITIGQLIHAAQLLEGNNVAIAMEPTSAFYKLGEAYEERFVTSKMRSALCLDAGSTGSSQRSSPTSMISGHSVPSSTPNSPAALLVPAGTGTRACGASPSMAQANNNRSSPSSTRQSRAAHNELEKNRRANLRNYLDNLKLVLPSDVDTSRDTTLSLLTRARNHIRTVKEHREQLLERRNQMLAEHIRLLEEVEQLKCQPEPQQAAAAAVVVPESNEGNCLTPPAYLEYSPSAKPLCASPAPNFAVVKCGGAPVSIDLYAEGLLPDVPLLYPYNYADQLRQLCGATANAC